MMKNNLFLLIACAATLSASAQQHIPQVGREFPTTVFMSYTTREAAQADKYAASPYFVALDGGAGEFHMPFAWADKQVFLHMDTGRQPVYVVVNDRQVGYTEGSEAPAEFDITPFVREGNNTFSITGGDVTNLYIKTLPRVRVRDFEIRTTLTEGYRNGVLDFGVIVKSHLLNEKGVRVCFELFSPSGELLKTEYRDVALRLRQEQAVHFEALVPNVRAWSSATPTLYTVMIRIQNEGRYTEYIQQKVGFRSVELVDGRLLLNGVEALPGACRIAAANMDFSAAGYAPAAPPANDPACLDLILDRVKVNYFLHRNDPSVAAFSLGESTENGYNFYEAYLWMKEQEKVRPTIFPGAAGQWNTDM